jgi:D-3-phosphoglycerate dehydrogenase
MKILANDGLDSAGKKLLQNSGFEVFTDKISQEELPSRISEYDVLVVRSATKVNAEILKASHLKLVARAGVGTDNIDLNCAANLGIPVVNTPDAATRSVAELVLAHLFSIARYLHESNREMPIRGGAGFNELKKKFSKGFELKGKKIGILGFGRIGQELARMSISLGMEVLVYDHKLRKFSLDIEFPEVYRLPAAHVVIQSIALEEVLNQADFVSVHSPGSDRLLGVAEFGMMRQGTCLINCARGGVVDEEALLAALDSGKIAFAGIDVFEKEPPVDERLLKHPAVSLSPQIGASTREGQERTGIEVAKRIIDHFN